MTIQVIDGISSIFSSLKASSPGHQWFRQVAVEYCCHATQYQKLRSTSNIWDPAAGRGLFQGAIKNCRKIDGLHVKLTQQFDRKQVKAGLCIAHCRWGIASMLPKFPDHPPGNIAAKNPAHSCHGIINCRSPWDGICPNTSPYDPGRFCGESLIGCPCHTCPIENSRCTASVLASIRPKHANDYAHGVIEVACCISALIWILLILAGNHGHFF